MNYRQSKLIVYIKLSNSTRTYWLGLDDQPEPAMSKYARLALVLQGQLQVLTFIVSFSAKSLMYIVL